MFVKKLITDEQHWQIVAGASLGLSVEDCTTIVGNTRFKIARRSAAEIETVELRPISTIKLYPGKPRHKDQAVDAVATSIRKCGFR